MGRKDAAALQLLQLRCFARPSRFLPHGVLGIISVVLGFLITSEALRNEYSTLSSHWGLTVYSLATAANAIAGFIMARHSRKILRLAFRAGSVMNICLSWYAWRFRPESAVQVPKQFEWCLRPLDVIASVGLLGCTATVPLSIYYMEYRGISTIMLLLIGMLGILTLQGWPLHVAIEGEAWLSCIAAQYPMQRSGLSGFVYVPVSWILSLFWFAVTLHDRGITNDMVLACGFGGTFGSLLVTLVLVMQFHLPVVSVQRLVLPCPEAPRGSALDALVRGLDLSVLATYILDWAGVPVVKQGVLERP